MTLLKPLENKILKNIIKYFQTYKIFILELRELFSAIKVKNKLKRKLKLTRVFHK